MSRVACVVSGYYNLGRVRDSTPSTSITLAPYAFAWLPHLSLRIFGKLRVDPSVLLNYFPVTAVPF